MRLISITLIILAALAAFVLWPGLDLIVSGWFVRPGHGFFLADDPAFRFIHGAAFYGARALGIFLALAALVTALRRKPLIKINSKAWLFLFLGLLIGPGLVANVIFKDHWGRARPSTIVEFGGPAHFSPPLIPAHQCARNCSFVAGDAAFGFYLPVFAYVVPRLRSRRVFWGGMGLGVLFGFARLVTGAHFLSDIVFAAFFMQAVLGLLHTSMFGLSETQKCWREWLFLSRIPAA